MRFNQSTVFLAVASVLSLQPSLANDTSTEAIEKVEVWSTKVKSSSLYVNSEDITSKQADHISDLLRTIPGVDVGGAHSLNQRITIRSMDDKDLKITIDGATQNTYMYHHMGNLQIHADILKSVDIEVGTNSIVNSGLGGAVRFETKSARDLLMKDQKLGARVKVSAGDNNGHNYALTAYGLLGDNIDVLAYHNSVSRDNYEVGGNKILDENGIEISGTNGEVKGLKGDIDDSLFKLGWEISDSQHLAFSYESYKDKGNYSYRPDMGLATDLTITNNLQVPLLWPTEFSRDTLTLCYDASFGDTTIDASAFLNTSELWRDEAGWAENDNTKAWVAVVTGEAENSGFNIIANTVINFGVEHDLTYGIDWVDYETSYRADAYSGTAQVSSEDAVHVGIFLEDMIDLGNGFTLTPGIRYDQFDITSKVVDDDFNDLLWAMAVSYQATNNLLFKLSATELFKGPEIGEVFTGAGLSDKENSDIQAESGVNTEFSFAYQDAVLGADALSFGATFFQTNIDDYIYDYAPIPNGGPRDYWKDNIGEMEIDGYEVYWGYQLGGFSALITYSNAESELSAFSDYATLEGARLDRQQGDTVSARFDYQFTDIDLDLHWEVLNVDDVKSALDLDGASVDNSKDGYTVHNISARWVPATMPELMVIVGVDNLFDEFYASQSSRTGVSFHGRFGNLFLTDYEPGRNIKATIAYQF